MLSLIRTSWSHRALAAATACSGLLATAPAAAGDTQSPQCPPGYELGALSFEEVVQLYAGLYTAEELAPSFAHFDANANGLLCFKQPLAFSQLPRFELHPYLFIDDPGGNPR